VFQKLKQTATSGPLPAGRWKVKIEVMTDPAGYTPNAYWTMAYTR
jgi:hypothetical protein